MFLEARLQGNVRAENGSRPGREGSVVRPVSAAEGPGRGRMESCHERTVAAFPAHLRQCRRESRGRFTSRASTKGT